MRWHLKKRPIERSNMLAHKALCSQRTTIKRGKNPKMAIKILKDLKITL